MEEIILYRPYKSNKWGALFPFFIGVSFIFLDFLFSTTFFSYLSIVMFLLSLVLYIEYSIVIAFGQNEIQVFENKIRKKYLWTDFHNAYYGRNFKGFQYLILSNKALDKKQVRNLCNKSSISLKNIWLDDILIIPIDEKNKAEIGEMLKYKLINIHCE